MNIDRMLHSDWFLENSLDVNVLGMLIALCVLAIGIVNMLGIVMMSTSAQANGMSATSAADKVVGAESVEKSCDMDGPRRRRLFRSLSVSIDLEFPERKSKAPIYYRTGGSWLEQQQKILAHAERLRTMSTNQVEKYRRAQDSDLTLSKASGLAMLRKMPETFPLQSLPEELKLKVFSFLSAKERGVAAQVCKEWSRLMMVPSLWSFVDFTVFPFCLRCSDQRRECNMLCYAAYKSRMKKFFYYLIAVRPALRQLKLEFDIDRDGWLDLIQSLLRAAYCHDLHSLYLNWKETTGRPPSSISSSHTWSTCDYNDLMFHHRHRQRLFVTFLDFVVTAAPNIESLTLPFDWSDRSMRAIGRLRNLRTLVLQTYFWTHWVEQSALTLLLQMTPGLKKLVLEVSSHSVQGLTPYVFESPSLEQLDMLESRGVYLARIDLPNLTTLRLSRQPISSPLVTVDAPTLPCIYQVLCDGAPRLRQLNGSTLLKDWNENLYEDLDTIMNAVCACVVHKLR